MARLLALATMVAGALATYNSGSSCSGSNCGGGSKSYGSGSNVQIEVQVGITIVSSCMGGSAPMNTIAPPPMATTGMMHKVVVGGNAGLVYTPPSISAAVGDMVEFIFMSANHTVTQSTFPLPCVKMQGGVDSGFMPNANNTVNPPPSMMFQVTTMDPIWMYCRQKTPTSHCGKGMVFSINPTADKTQAQFAQMAMQQNGTASSMAPPPPPASTMAPPPPPPPPATMAPPPPPPAATGIVGGSGSNNGGSCSCSCLCAVAAFPVGDGIGMWGGMSGSLPASYMV